MTSPTTTPAQAQTTMIMAVNRLRLQTVIGLLPQEKTTPQPLEFTLKLFFEQPLAACASDAITGTVCYDALCTAIKNATDATQCETIEHLAQTVFSALRETIPHTARLWLKLSKCQPPVESLEGSADIILSDLPAAIAWSIA